MSFRFPLFATALGALLPLAGGIAAPLTEAHVTKIVNDVKLVEPGSVHRPAKVDDVVRDEVALTTGIKSRSELVFQDHTLTRLGPESYFSFKSGTRDMTLEKGTMLLQVPKNQGGARIHTAAVTAAITGTTVMFEYLPNKSLKFLVLEGSMRLSMNGRFGDPLLLTPGKMVIMPPNAKRIPDPVTIDLKKVVQTSKLVNMSGGKKGQQANGGPDKLPSMALIDQEVEHQQTGKDSHHLVATNLVILGKGTNVTIGTDDLLRAIDAQIDIEKLTPQATPEPTPVSTPNPAPTPNPNPPPTGTPPPPPPSAYLTDNTTVIKTLAAAPAITTQGVTSNGASYKDVNTNGSPSAFLFGSTSTFDNEFGFDNFYLREVKQSAVFTLDSLQLGGGITFNVQDGMNGVSLVGNNGITNSAATTVNLGGIGNVLFATTAGNINFDSGITFNGSADHSKPTFLGLYARGGDVNLGATFNLANTDLQFAAEHNAVVGAGASITAKNLTVTGLQTVQFDGTATVDSLFQLNGGAVELGGTINGKSGFLYGSSAIVNGTYNGETLTANVTGDFTLNGTVSLVGSHNFQVTAGGIATFAGLVSGNVAVHAHDILFSSDFTIAPNSKGELTATGGNIDATGHSLSNFDNITVTTGNLYAGSLSAKNLSVAGILGGGSLSATTISAGALNADSVTATNSLTVTTSALSPYSGSTLSLNAPNLNLAAGANLDGGAGTAVTAPGNAFNLAITTGNYTLSSPFSLKGGDGDPAAADAGGNGGQLDLTSSGNLTVNAPITATTGQNSNSAMTGGNGGTVNLTAQNTIAVNNNIEVSSSDGNRRSSASGGHINIKSNAGGGTAISISSSAQLLALLNATAPGSGGSIKFTSAGGAINMNGTARADRGSIEMTNNGTNGQVNLTNATLAADTIKVGALGTNGTLTIGGGTISADSLIHLYAGGSNGTVNFTDNVTLSGNSAKTIAANTVTVFNGKVVTINGPTAADVFTNHPNYTGFGGNGSTTGTFAGQGANTHPFSGAPGY